MERYTLREGGRVLCPTERLEAALERLAALAFVGGAAFGAAFGAAAGKDFPTILGGHSLAEAVDFLTMKLFGLVGTFGSHELHLRYFLLNKPDAACAGRS